MLTLGALLTVKAGHNLPAWGDRAGYGVPDRLPSHEWLIIVRCGPSYKLYDASTRNVTFLCRLGVRSCYWGHVLENCEDT